MTEVAGSARSPSEATRPSTVTRPAAISSSHARRDPMPAEASTFCSRCGPSVSKGDGAGRGLRRSALGKFGLVDVVGQERAERGQVLHAVEPDLLQEQPG